jgi:hypothetical protein
MATVTGLTAERMLEIEAASVVDGDVSGNDLLLTRKDGSVINAGNVRGVPGPEGPMGSALDVVTAQPVLDIGIINQIRAGRQLSLADFTGIGLNDVRALWNLSNANDSSGNARHLTIKGDVPFAPGINGLPATAAQFSGSTAQALYIPDAANGPFALRQGSIGIWHRCSRKGYSNYFFVRSGQASGTWSWYLGVQTNGSVIFSTFDGATPTGSVQCFTDICDDRWHHVTATWDGTKNRVYIDGMLECEQNQSTSLLIYTGAAPVTLGGYAGSDPATSNPSYARLDEAFVLGDVANEDQIQYLRAASIPHALGSVPKSVHLGVRRKRRGVLAVSDFPSQPLRLYNLTNGSLADEGSQNAPLTIGAGNIIDAAGPDGDAKGAKHFYTGHGGLRATDAGLGFTAAQPRTHGCWFKSMASAVGGTMYSWGSDERLQVSAANAYSSYNAPDMISVTAIGTMEGLWHFGVVVEDPNDPVAKRKLYLDNRLIAISQAINAITVANNASGFAIGMNATSGGFWLGDIDAVFVHPAALNPDELHKLWCAGAKQLGIKPAGAEDHIQAVELGRILATFDAIDSCNSIDLAVTT